MNRSETTSRRERVVRYRADPSLSRDRAAARISAYLYGNIIAFATLVPLTADDVEHGHGLRLVLGVAVSTYLAHVFSEVVGRQVRADEPMTRGEVWHEIVDSRPIATSVGGRAC